MLLLKLKVFFEKPCLSVKMLTQFQFKTFQKTIMNMKHNMYKKHKEKEDNTHKIILV